MSCEPGPTLLHVSMAPPRTACRCPPDPQTLMDVILGRKTVGLIRGDILVRAEWRARVNDSLVLQGDSAPQLAACFGFMIFPNSWPPRRAPLCR